MAGGRLADGIRDEFNDDIEATAKQLCLLTLNRRLFSDHVSSLYPVGLPSIVFREDKFAYDETWTLCRLSTVMQTLTLGAVEHRPSKIRYCDPRNAAIFIDRNTASCAWHRTVLSWTQLLTLQGKNLTVLDENGTSMPLKLIRHTSTKTAGMETAFMSLANWQSEAITRQAEELGKVPGRVHAAQSVVHTWQMHSAA